MNDRGGDQFYDAIVVGSGAAGAFAAKALTEGGLETLLLEAGPELRPDEDFPHMGPRDRRDAIWTRLLAAMSGQRVQARSPSFMAFVRHLYVNDRENPYTTPTGKPFFWIRGRQVGGRLHTWAGMALRMSDRELHGASHDGYGVDWPISYEELAPYYDKVETCLGLYGNADGLPHVPDGRYVAPRELTARELAFKSAVESRWPDRHVIQARVTAHNSGRVPIPIAEARATGRLTVRPNAVVTRVTTDPDSGKASGVEFVDRTARRSHQARGRLVMLCASALESVRILLNSGAPRYPDGIGGSSGVLGRFIMDHCHVHRHGYFAEPVHQPPQHADDPYDFGASQGFYIPSFRNVARPHDGFLRGYGVLGAVGRLHSMWWLAAFGEMLPRAENRVVLNLRKVDAWGIPVAHIECTWSENERALIADAKRNLEEMTLAAGLPPERRFGKSALVSTLLRAACPEPGVFYPGLAVHELGGARMGDDPETSVLNPFNRCWEVENLVVADGACFVSSGYQNPTLTIMALSLRAAECVVSDFERVAL
jgi:choline dehydrogenase-like flavoprotein